MTGLLDVSPYLPAHALTIASIGATLGRGGGAGVRSVAGFDEDATTMAVAAVRGLPREVRNGAKSLWFSTTHPPYLDKTNATAIHAACHLDPTVPAYDGGSSVRSGMGSIRAAADGHGIAVLADLWSGLPGSDDERLGGDAAVALAFGSDDDAIAVLEGWRSFTLELLERWRLPADVASQSWDDRFGAEAASEPLRTAIAELAAEAGQVRHIVVSAANPRTTAAVVRGLEGTLASTSGIGFAGSADVGLKLLVALEAAEPGDGILVAVIGDGVEAFVLRVTDRIAGWRRSRARLADWTTDRHEVSYPSVLVWRGRLECQPPRRPEPVAPAAPPTLRSNTWKFGLLGGRCRECGTVHAPPERRCRGCGATATQDPHEFDRPARVSTVTVDHLAYSPAPPTILAIVDLGDGARAPFEVADVAPGAVSLGDEVEPTFRRLYTAGGVHDYFWKVRPPRRPVGVTSEGETCPR